jgi:hypothetical protein
VSINDKGVLIVKLIRIEAVPFRRISAIQMQVYCETADVVTVEKALTNLYVYGFGEDTLPDIFVEACTAVAVTSVKSFFPIR